MGYVDPSLSVAHGGHSSRSFIVCNPGASRYLRGSARSQHDGVGLLGRTSSSVSDIFGGTVGKSILRDGDETRSCDRSRSYASIPPNDWTYLEMLNEVVQQEPATSLDPELMGPVAAIQGKALRS
jgi:hypothetical protein